MQKYSKCFGEGSRGVKFFLSLFHVLDNFKNKIFEKNLWLTKINRHFLLLYGVICFTLYTWEIARNHLLYFLACKCVIYFRMTYLLKTLTCRSKSLNDNTFPKETIGLGVTLVPTGISLSHLPLITMDYSKDRPPSNPK